MKKQTKKATATKKRNPQDATLRNIRALKTRLDLLEAKVAWMQEKVGL